MRFISAAQIVVLDADAARCAELVTALGEIGLARIVAAESPAAVRRLAARTAVDLCLVDVRGVVGAGRAGDAIPNNPLTHLGVPAILLSWDNSRAARTGARAAGYSAVVMIPVAPRRLYRRIASILQRARRRIRSGGRVEDASPAASKPAND